MIRYFFFIICLCTRGLWSLTPEQIDHLTEETLRQWEIPGLALAVIQQGEEPYIQGYGVRERGTDKRVDIETLFQINSLTKAFTAITVNGLVKEGKLDWDAPLTAYIPNFQSKDPQVTEELSLRDLLCHRTGFPGNLHEGWRLWRNTYYTLENLIQRLAFIDLTLPFRSHYNYDNLGYAIAGEVVARTTGIPWKEFCCQNIFAPLGMNRTTISYALFAKDDNAALPHTYQVLKPISGYDWEKDSMEAASGINSCAKDMALWLRYCLTHHSEFSEILKSHILINPEDFLLETDLPSFEIISHGKTHLHYTMGWWYYSIENTAVYRHTGSSAGMQSVLSIVPEKGIGVVILSNQAKHPAISALMNQLIDALLEQPEVDWQALCWKAFTDTKENEKKWFEKHLLARQKEIPPSLPLHKYAGTYTHPGYGSVAVKEGEQGLGIELIFCGEQGGLDHWEGNQFEIVNTPSGSLKPFLGEFLIDPQGEDVTGFKINEMGIFISD